MTICPINGLVLIRPLYPTSELRSPGGLLILPQHSVVSPEGVVLHESHNPLYATRGEVLAVDEDEVLERILPGEFVIFSPYSGRVVVIDGEPLITIHYTDVLCVVEDIKEHHAAA